MTFQTEIHNYLVNGEVHFANPKIRPCRRRWRIRCWPSAISTTFSPRPQSLGAAASDFLLRPATIFSHPPISPRSMMWRPCTAPATAPARRLPSSGKAAFNRHRSQQFPQRRWPFRECSANGIALRVQPPRVALGTRANPIWIWSGRAASPKMHLLFLYMPG